MNEFKTSLSQMVFWVSPQNICYCNPSSNYTDINQHEKDRMHPHAFYDRGYFYESERKGEILTGNWDKATLKFEDLLEYKALYNHAKGIEKWSLSIFAKRVKDYILMNNNELHGYCSFSNEFDSVDDFIKGREVQINTLIKSIRMNGVIPTAGVDCQNSNLDDISVNISRTGKLLFNNRGHHRLSIAKIFNIKLIPVQIIVWHRGVFI
jgi:hypothetical protein